MEEAEKKMGKGKKYEQRASSSIQIRASTRKQAAWWEWVWMDPVLMLRPACWLVLGRGAGQWPPQERDRWKWVTGSGVVKGTGPGVQMLMLL